MYCIFLCICYVFYELYLYICFGFPTKCIQVTFVNILRGYHYIFSISQPICIFLFARFQSRTHSILIKHHHLNDSVHDASVLALLNCRLCVHGRREADARISSWTAIVSVSPNDVVRT